MATSREGYERLWAEKIGRAGHGVPLRLRAAVDGLAPGERLLDVGCGEGRVADAAGDRFGELFGVDGAAVAVERARARGVRALQVDLDAGRLPFPDAHFDAVLCLDVVEHLVDPNPLVAELARVVRPGGSVVVTTPNVRSVRQLWRIAVRGEGPRTSGDRFGVDGGHLHYFTFADVERMARAAGLRVVDRRGLVPRLPRLGPAARLWPVRELLAAGLLVRATR